MKAMLIYASWARSALYSLFVCMAFCIAGAGEDSLPIPAPGSGVVRSGFWLAGIPPEDLPPPGSWLQVLPEASPVSESSPCLAESPPKKPALILLWKGQRAGYIPQRELDRFQQALSREESLWVQVLERRSDPSPGQFLRVWCPVLPPPQISPGDEPATLSRFADLNGWD